MSAGKASDDELARAATLPCRRRLERRPTNAAADGGEGGDEGDVVLDERESGLRWTEAWLFVSVRRR